MLLRAFFSFFSMLFLLGNHAIAQDCTVPFVPSQFKARLAWQSGQDGPSVVTAPVVANMNPQKDSLPEIMVLEGSVNSGTKLQFYRGDGSNASNPFLLTIPGGFDSYPAPTPTVGDVDGDGIPELLIACSDRRIRVFHNYTENPAAPMTLWITANGLLDYAEQRPYLADFNGDGTPEVYAGSNIYVFNFSNPAAPTLTKVINSTNFQGRAQFSGFSQGSCNPTAVDILSVADCNGDPDCAGLELVAGPVIYSIDLDPNDGDGYQIKAQRNLNNLINQPPAGYSDGYTSVADLDLDGVLDIVVTSVRQGNQYGMYIWNKNGLVRFFPYPNNVNNSGSLACIANVFDDTKQGYALDYPEILVCNSLNLTCFNLHAAQTSPATPYWWNLPTTDGSGWTGSTVYDFNGDGISEIVYRDEENLRILYGGKAPFPPGVDAERNWFKTPCFSATSDEYPVVADVDNDGETEIAVTGRLTENHFQYRGRLRVFESDSGPWVPCRNVWNQFNYFIVNVNDDLSIPAQQAVHHLELPSAGSGKRPLNTYLSQRPQYNDSFNVVIPLPDASAMVSQVLCQGDSLSIQIEVCNTGDMILAAGTPISFYSSDPTTTNASLVGMVQSIHVQIKKDSCKTFTFTIPKVASIQLYGVLNDDGSVATPFQLGVDFPTTNALECNFLNNLFQFTPPPPTSAVNLGPDLTTCQDTAVLLNAGPGFSDYLWQDGSTASTFQTQQAGLYWVQTTDQCAQKQQDSVWVEVYEKPFVQLDTINGNCFGAPAVVTASAQSAFLPLQYTWSSGDNTPSVIGLTDGTYTVTVTNAKGCTSTQSSWVEAGGNLQIAASIGPPILCFGQNSYLNLAIVIGNPPYAVQWSDGSQTFNVANVPAGSYAVTVTDADHCADTLQIVIDQPDPLLSSGLMALPSCPGLSTGSASFQGASQGTPPYSLLWSNNETTPNLSNIATGSYQLTLSDANGCSLVENVQVPEFQAPALTITQSDVSCFGANDGSILVNLQGGSPGFGFLWSNNSTTNQIHDLLPGDYALTLTYANGRCSEILDYPITEPLPILLTAVPSPALCNGALNGGIALSVQNGLGPLAYSWSNNTVSQDLINVGAGTYQVTVTDAGGCSKVLAGQVLEPTALLSAGTTSESACLGESNGEANFLGASQGTPPYQLLWSNNQNTPNLSGLPAGNYQLTLTDAHGCSLVENVPVGAFLPPLVQDSVSDVLCFGSNNGSISVDITGGSPGFGYIWSNNATTADIQGLTPGNYALTISYANGKCVDHFNYTITEPTALLLSNPVITPVRCFGGNDGGIDMSVNGGTTPYQYGWSDNQHTEDISNLPAGNYTLILTDAHGCSLQSQMNVPQPPALVLATNISADTCQTSSGAIDLSVSGGVAPYGYAWSNLTISPDLSNLSPGNYLLTLTDANGCTQERSVPVPKYGEIPLLNPFTDTLTCVQTAVSVGVAANQNNLHYTWQTPMGSLSDAAQHLVQTPGNYQVTATNAFGCQSVAQMQVTENVAVPKAEAGPPNLNILCDETAGLLNAAGSSEGSRFLNRWIWISNGQVALDTVALLLPITAGGLYVHTVLDLQNGCKAQDSILVHWDAPILAAFELNPIRCFGDDDGSVDIHEVTGGNPPFVYSIENQAFSAQHTFSNLSPGQYTLHARDNFGCAWETAVQIKEPEELQVQLSANDTLLFLGQTLQLQAQPMPNGVDLAAIEWQPEGFTYSFMSLKQQVKPETRTEFGVRITDQNGCVAEDRLWISVFNNHIYVPNIIVPGTEENGWFTIFAGDGVPEIRLLRIYDRWGEQMYERQGFPPNDPSLGWDGLYRGAPMNPGVFVWYAEVLMFDGRVVFLKGDVTVAR